MGKGSKRRPRTISREEEDLRWKLASGHITFETFRRKYLEMKRKGLLRRSGKVLK